MIVFGSTLPASPGFTAVTPTSASVGKTCNPTSRARPTVMVRSVRKRTPDWVLTTLPPAIVFDAVKSTLRNVTVPLACASSTRLPVVVNVSDTETGTSIRLAGTMPASGSVVAAFGSARTVREIGGIGSAFGVTLMLADGR